jgi:hypothetical protein
MSVADDLNETNYQSPCSGCIEPVCNMGFPGDEETSLGASGTTTREGASRRIEPVVGVVAPARFPPVFLGALAERDERRGSDRLNPHE